MPVPSVDTDGCRTQVCSRCTDSSCFLSTSPCTGARSVAARPRRHQAQEASPMAPPTNMRRVRSMAETMPQPWRRGNSPTCLSGDDRVMLAEHLEQVAQERRLDLVVGDRGDEILGLERD